jgi:hypothetical protein
MSIAQKMAIYAIKRDAIDHPETFRKLLQNSQSGLLDAYDKVVQENVISGQNKRTATIQATFLFANQYLMERIDNVNKKWCQK